jgi:hypothetical protein
VRSRNLWERLKKLFASPALKDVMPRSGSKRDPSRLREKLAKKARRTFNRNFWNPNGS